MRRKISYILICLLSFIVFNKEVNAGSLSIWANKSSVYVGDTVTISVSANNLAGSFNIISSDSSVLSGGASNVWLESNTYTYTFTAKSTGSATISAKPISVSDTEGAGGDYTDTKSVTISVVNKPSPSSGGSSGSSGGRSSSSSRSGTTADKKTYSSNNYLENLSIEGYDLSPSFDKETLEYNVEVPNDVTKVNINASVEDDKAEVSGTGEIEVSEGSNKIEVKVTAENGNEKVYVINVTVKELDPIEVTVNKKKYTIVRKEGLIDPPENYEKDSITINGEEVLCYKNKVTKNILIALKDDKGEIKYFSYDEKKKTYTIYQPFNVGGLYLSILDMPKNTLPSGFTKLSFTFDNNKIEGYQNLDSHVSYAADSKVRGKDFYLIYAQNEVTGNKGIYVYDKLENTVQRLDTTMFDMYKDKADKYFLYFLISLIVLATTIITFIVITIIKKKKHKKKKK